MKTVRIGYTSGVYDMFHIGHLNILKRAKENCDYLVVGVTTDKLCFKRKNKNPIICEQDRVEIVKSIKYVDKVVLQEDMDKLKMVKELGANIVFVGSDWEGTPAWIQYEKEFATVGCKVCYLPHTEGISSTILRKLLNEADL